jgi:predicted dehydrogenase
MLVIGAGSIGSRHAGNCCSHGDVALLDCDPARAEKVAGQLGIPGFSSEQDAWDWAPEGVIVATPTHLHLEYANKALENGVKAVLLEKPISHSLDGVDSLLNRAVAQGARLFVVTNMRFHPAVQAVKENINLVGRPLFARGHFGNYLPNMRPDADYRTLYAANRAQGGGVILDVIHEIDYMSWLFGEVTAITASAATLSDLDIDVEDYATLILEHGCGVRTTLTMDYLQQYKRRGCEIIGTDGTLIWESEGKNPEQCRVRIYDKKSGCWKTLLEQDGVDAALFYQRQIEEFVAAIDQESDRLADATQGYQALKVALAAHRSAQTGCRVDSAEMG